MLRGQLWPSVGLVTRGCGFESRLRQELSTTEVRRLSKGPNPRLLPGLPTAPGVCALGWVKCREHISLLVILCIIVYVTNKAYLSLIIIIIFLLIPIYLDLLYWPNFPCLADNDNITEDHTADTDVAILNGC